MEITGRDSPQNRIRYWRKFRGFKQETLRKKLGLKSRSTISHWENGISNPDPKQLFELKEILNCEIGDLYPEQEAWAKEKHSNRREKQEDETTKKEKCETHNDDND